MLWISKKIVKEFRKITGFLLTKGGGSPEGMIGVLGDKMELMRKCCDDAMFENWLEIEKSGRITNRPLFFVGFTKYIIIELGYYLVLGA